MIKPGSRSALLHRHSKSEEFIYIIQGQATLITESGETLLNPGECVGFTPKGEAHMLINRGNEDVHYLEIGDREAGDTTDYPADDIKAENIQGKWVFTHKDGSPY